MSSKSLSRVTFSSSISTRASSRILAVVLAQQVFVFGDLRHHVFVVAIDLHQVVQVGVFLAELLKQLAVGQGRGVRQLRFQVEVVVLGFSPVFQA